MQNVYNKLFTHVEQQIRERMGLNFTNDYMPWRLITYVIEQKEKHIFHIRRKMST